MITEKDFQKYKKELQSIDYIPNGWSGKKQNDSYDNKINLFKIYTKKDLFNNLISANVDEKDKDYYIRRWLIIMLERCDRYLFSQNSNVIDNPNHLDQSYDFIIRGVKLDLKSTRIPIKVLESIFCIKFNIIYMFLDKDNKIYYNIMMKKVRA